MATRHDVPSARRSAEYSLTGSSWDMAAGGATPSDYPKAENIGETYHEHLHTACTLFNPFRPPLPEMLRQTLHHLPHPIHRQNYHLGMPGL